MSRRNVMFASLGLTACICWTATTLFAGVSKAEADTKSTSASSLSASDTLVPAEADRGVPVATAEPSFTPQMADMSHVRPWDGVVAESEPTEDGGLRGACTSIYQNIGGSFVFIISDDGIAPNTLVADDITPTAGSNRFVCDVKVVEGWCCDTAGVNHVLRCQIYAPFAAGGPCPDTGSVLLAEDIILSASPVINTKTFLFDEVLVPNTFGVGLLTPAAGVAGDGPSWAISDAVEMGSSVDAFFIEFNPGDSSCTGEFFFFGGSPLANMGVTVDASPGPTGSCCNQTTGACSDGVLLTGCNAFGQRFSLDPCPQTPACAICDINCVNNENEPVCAANYIDTTNNGCSFDEGTESFIDIACGASVCGEFGTYTFLNGTVTENRRDNDYYRFTLTSTQRVTWSVTAELTGANALIFIPAGTTPCDDLRQSTATGDVSAASSSAGCSAAVATVCLPPGTYYAVARAITFTGIPCGTDYQATLTCVDCILPTGACCKPDGNCAALSSIECLQLGGVYRGDATDCGSANCPQPPTNETCATKSTLTGNKTIAIDTTFAVTEDTTDVTGCTPLGGIYKDIWYDYAINAADHPAGVSFGRLVASTWESCFDSRVAIYKVAVCTDPQGTQCSTLDLRGCNDDINVDRGNLASYLEIVDDGTGGEPLVGQCYKIRVGGTTEDDAGPGFLRVDFVPSGLFPWTSGSGRCCFSGGSCSILTASGDPGDCTAVGGYLTAVTNFGEGDPLFQEIASVGCNVWPCPAAGEACFNALNLTDGAGGDPDILPSGFGTTTRAITNRLFYKYKIPVTAAVGSGITFSTCGSDFDTAIAIYSDFNQTTGDCTGETPLVTNNNCSPAETSAGGSQGIASCFGIGQVDSCTCITVGNIGDPTGPGSVIYVEVGAANTIANSPQATIDPVPENCGDAVTASLTVTASDQCFVCVIPCPGGSVMENEPVCAANYVDTTNGGCNSTPPVFTDIACGNTVCGEAGTYTFQNGTTTQNRRDTDWYRFSVTTAKRLTISMDASFPATVFLAQVFDVGNPCTDFGIIASATAAGSCLNTQLVQDICPGTFLVIVVPNTFSGIDCGSDYSFTLTCGNPVFDACCPGDMNNDGVRNGKDIKEFLVKLFNPPTGPFPVTGCYSPNTCHADFNGNGVIETADIPGFVTVMLAAAACPATVPPCSNDPGRCHLPDQTGGAVSALSSTLGCRDRVADDFRADSSGNIASICWYGFYYQLILGQPCSPQDGSSPDSFVVTFYNDNAGVPGTIKAGPFSGMTVTKTLNSTIDFGAGGVVNEYRYSATLPSTVSVTSGTCYWIEIVNNPTGACCWLWSFGGFSNGIIASRRGGPAGTANYVADDVVSAGTDMAFCLNEIQINKQDCGLPQGRCCTPSFICSVTDEYNCVNVLNGAWVEGMDCTGGCPPPGADLCANANPLQLNVVAQGTTQGQTTDGPTMTCEGGCGGACNTAPDVWYTFTPAAGGPTTASCCVGPVYDQVMVVYTGSCGALTEAGCGDDTCGNVAGMSVVSWNAVANTTYRIRLSGWAGGSGQYSLIVTQP